MPRYNHPPHWLTSRFASQCPHCKGTILKGERIFYYPSTKLAYCAAEDCGLACYRQFQSAAQDEAVYNGTGDPY